MTARDVTTRVVCPDHAYRSLRETRQQRADGSMVTPLQLAERGWNPPNKRSDVRLVDNGGRADDPQTAERLRPRARGLLTRGAPEEIVAQPPRRS